MDGTTAILFAAGLALLILGAELLVRGASRLAAAVGISPLVIGLTVVSFGTSAPELAISVQAAWSDQADLAFGNVVGSNAFNVLFILGIAAIIGPLVVHQQLVRFDVPLMIVASALLLVLSLDGSLGRLDGALLFAGIVAYNVLLVRQSRRQSAALRADAAGAVDQVETGDAGRGGGMLVQIGLVVAGLALLVLGSRWLVDGAVEIAAAFGVSELVIGLTIVAAGTSLPEVATSIIASLRGERDIAVGNVVGSNIYNILAILGLSALAAPDGLPVAPSLIRFDLPITIAVALACLPIFVTGHRIARWEGALFLGYYVAYVLYLILDATDHDALPAYSLVMLLFVLPLTAITLVVVAIRTRTPRSDPPTPPAPVPPPA